MHSKGTLAGLVTASMIAGCGVLPQAPGTGDDAEPPAYVNVVNTEEIRIKLIPQNESGAARNDHPAAFEPDQIEALLSSLRLSSEDGAEATLTSPSRLNNLAAGLSRAFVRAGPRQDIAFAVFRRGSGSLISGAARRATAGRAFYRGKTLNLIFGEFDDEFSEFRNLRTSGFKYGSRVAERDVDGERLVANGTWQWHGDRRDWIEMAATPQAIETARDAAPRVIESSVSSAAKPLEYGPAASAGTTPVPSVREPAQAVTQPAQPTTDTPAAATPAAATPAAATPAAATPVSATANEDWSRIEERLTQLKRLRDKNLISDQDYQNKKDALLRQLP